MRVKSIFRYTAETLNLGNVYEILLGNLVTSKNYFEKEVSWKIAVFSMPWRLVLLIALDIKNAL